MESLGATVAGQKMDECEDSTSADQSCHIISPHAGEDAPSTGSGSDSVRETDSSAIPVSKERRRRWHPDRMQKQMLEDAYIVMKRNGSLRHREVDELTARLSERGSLTKKNVRKWFQNRKYQDQKHQQQVEAAQIEAGQPPEQKPVNTLEGCSSSQSEQTEIKNETEDAGFVQICEDEQGFLYVGRPRKPTPSPFDF